MKKISVVTINYNSEKSTQKLLDSLTKTKVDGFILEIIVVDNGSVNPIKLTGKIKGKDIILINSEINTGFTGGNNIGIKHALEHGADFVLIINNDTTVIPETIISLKKALEKDERIGAVVPKIYFTKGHEYHKEIYKEAELGNVIWYAGGIIDWKNVKSNHRGMDQIDKGQFDRETNTEFATGCCMLMKREVLEKVGLFDDRYFLYYEDWDISERIKKAGYSLYYVPSAVVYHANAQSTGGSGSGLHDYFLTRNQMLFGMKYAPLKTKNALIRQSIRLFSTGRKYQKMAIKDYYMRRFGKGSYFDK